MQNGGQTADLVIKRGTQKFTLSVTPKYDEKRQRFLVGVVMLSKGPLIDIGIYPKDELASLPRAGLAESVKSGIYDGFFTIKLTMQSLVMIFTQSISVDELSGPIGVTKIVGDTYTETKNEAGLAASILVLANIMALLSANLGIMNLLPIPALDGGRLLIYMVEVIRGKRIPPEKEGMINLAGIALMMALAVFVAFNDITKLIK
ncbi:MAG: site-2 protease family protein, partial [Firmicutes bacterium]|nr:site-2 protease family protein [Bacillota bacterium]